MFQHFARYATDPEQWVTRVTGVTKSAQAQKSAEGEVRSDPHQKGNTRVTEGNTPPAVTLLSGEGNSLGNRQSVARTAENRKNCRRVTRVTHVTCASAEAHSAQQWSTEDWLAFYGERAAIAEFDGKLDRAAAETQTWRDCIQHWLAMNPPPASGADICAHCQRPLGEAGRDGVPHLAGEAGHIWLHHGCVKQFHARRRKDAVRALQGMGLHRRMGRIEPRC